MTTYQGLFNSYTIIEPRRAKGGEGEIFDIQGQSDLVLKRLEPKYRNTTRKNKLMAMINAGVPRELMPQLTWPIDVVSENGQFIGYVMPALHQTEDLNVIYSDKYHLTLEDRIGIAMNLCVPVHGLHLIGQVVGDGNAKNICVDPQTLSVTFVDTDSYNITDVSSGRVYPCEVGLAAYLAPEVQKALKQYHSLLKVPEDTFNVYTDRFWLAEHIFALLMNGAHPFAVRASGAAQKKLYASGISSVTVPMPNENILNGFFPHTMHHPEMDIPFYCPKFEYLPEEMKELFHRAFVDGYQVPAVRPAPEEWFHALLKMKNSLVPCSKNSAHQHPASASFCPWCELEERKVPMPKLPPANALGIITGSTYGPSGGGNGIGGRRRRGGIFGSCLGAIFAGLLSLAVLLAVPVACTVNMMDIHKAEQEYKVQQNQQKIEELRQKAEAKQAEEAEAQAREEALLAARPQGAIQAQQAEYFSFVGHLSDSLEETAFEMDITRAGYYLFETAGTDLNLKLRVEDETGYSHEYWLSDQAGDFCAAQLEPGRYRVEAARQFNDQGSFCLKIWMQKETLNLSSYRTVHDSLQFYHQTNVYRYTCSQSGRYHILLSEMSGKLERVTIHVADENGNTLYSDWCGTEEGFGPYLDLTEGTEYVITVGTYTGLGGYVMEIV